MATTDVQYDQEAYLITFDSTKSGVKGLVDSQITSIPCFFHLPSDDQIPIVDLQHPDHSVTIEAIEKASSLSITAGMIEGVRRFYEDEDEDEEIRTGLYSRDHDRKLKRNSNFDLFHSRI